MNCWMQLEQNIGCVLCRRIINHDESRLDGQKPKTFALVLHEGTLRCIWLRNKCRDDKVIMILDGHPDDGLNDKEWDKVKAKVMPYYKQYGDSLFGLENKQKGGSKNG